MPDPPSTLKVAAVTGGMGGISQGIVIALTQPDFDVVAGDRTIDPAIAERMTTNATTNTTNAALGARLSFIRSDLADPGDLPASSMQYSLPSFTAFGHIERLVNNTGLPAKSRGELFDVSAESYDLRRECARCVLPAQAVCKKMLAAEADFPEKRAFGRVHILLECCHRSPGARRSMRCPKRRSPDG